MAISFSGWQSTVDAERKGAENAQALFENMRKARAYNALRAQYGDQVGNLDWTQAQSAYGAQQKLPYELDRLGLGNEQTRQSIDYDAQANPLRLQAAQQSIDTQRQNYEHNALANPLERERTSLGNRKAGAALAEDDRERQRNAVQGLVAAAEPRIDAGEDPGKVFDELAPQMAALEGATPEEIARYKQMFMANPKGFLQAAKRSLEAVRPEAATRKIANDEARIRQAQERIDLAKAKQNPPVTEPAVAAQEAQNEHVMTTLDRIEKNADKVFQAAPLRALQERTGISLTHADTAYRQDIGAIKASLGLDALARLKVDKGTSLGQVTHAEHDLLQKSVSALDAARDPQEVKQEIKRIRQFYQRYQTALRNYMASRPGGEAAYRAYREGREGGASAAPAGGNSAVDDALKLYGGR